MAWPDTSLVAEVKLELAADLTADPTTYTFATDITSFTFDRSGDSSIIIRRGRTDEQSVSQPSACGLEVENTDGRFSARNPVGTYYPGLRRNTPLRVRVNPGTGLTTRYVGFVSEWPPRWDVREVDHNVPVRADGILRRLGQGASPLKSALSRGLPATLPTAWWPLEGGAPTSGLAGGATMTQVGQVQYRSETGQAGSDALPDFTGGGSLSAPVPNGSVSNDWRIELVARFGIGSDTISDADFTIPVRLTSPSGNVNIWELLVSTGTAIFQWADTSGAYFDLLDSGIAVDDGQWHHFRLTATQSGGNIVAQITIDGGTTFSSTLVGKTLNSTGSSIGVNPDREVAAHVGSVGHLAYWAPFGTAINTTPIAAGYAGEVSGTRFARLCTEESIPDDVTAGSTEAMGPQGIKTLLELLRECEAAEEGLIVERLDGRLGFDPHADRENQTVALTLDYSSKHVSPPLEPTDDDQRIRNDVTVTRTGGPKGTQVVDTTGPVGVTAVGRYDDSVELNLYTDDQPYNHAGWRVNLGTVDGLRWPTVTVNLRRNNSLTASFLALDIGSRIKITNLPDIVSYDDVDLIVEGYTEQISQKNWVITFNCAPYRPWKVFTLANTTSDTGEFLGRLDWDTCVLAAGINTVVTSMTTTTTPLITTAADDFPLTILVEGERMTVTNCTGSSNPQTLTVTRSVNGVVKAHLSAAVVQIDEPMVLAL